MLFLYHYAEAVGDIVIDLGRHYKSPHVAEERWEKAQQTVMRETTEDVTARARR